MNAPTKIISAWEAELMAYVAESNARYRKAKAEGTHPHFNKTTTRSADQADLEDYADEQGRMPNLFWENV